MSARDDYPELARFAAERGTWRAQRTEAHHALDEIDRLRSSIDLIELRRLRRENAELVARFIKRGGAA